MPTVTILIVDDEPSIREFVGHALRERGYEVLEAGDGLDALALAGAYPGPIHLLLTDVRMPRLDGSELCRRLKSHRPGTKILVMSSGADIRVEPGAAFLRKPFTPRVLVRAVDGLLNAANLQALGSP